MFALALAPCQRSAQLGITRRRLMACPGLIYWRNMSVTAQRALRVLTAPLSPSLRRPLAHAVSIAVP
jgi:hypothetical protein